MMAREGAEYKHANTYVIQAIQFQLNCNG
jgi:hypothetical protein